METLRWRTDIGKSSFEAIAGIYRLLPRIVITVLKVKIFYECS